MRTALLLIFALAVLGCSSSRDEGSMSLTPSAPELDETLTIRFVPELSASALAESEEVRLRFTLLAGDGTLHSESVPMEKAGARWEASLNPSDLLEDPALMVFAFVDGADHEIFDNNQGKSWMIPLNKGGKPAPGANLQTYRLLAGRERLAELLSFPRDREGAREYLARERELYPENFRAQRLEWEEELEANKGSLPDSLTRHIALQLGERLAGWQDWDELPMETVDLLDFYWKIDRRDEMLNIRDAMLKRFPEGEATAEILHYGAMREMNMPLRFEQLEELHARFPDWRLADEDRGYIIYWCLGGLNLPDKANEVVDSGLPIEPSFASYLAQRYLTLGDSERATKLLTASLEGYAADEWSPEGMLCRGEWARDRDEGRAAALFTLADLHIREGVSRDALPHLERILDEYPAHADEEVLRALVGIQTRMGMTDAAQQTYELLAKRTKMENEELEDWRKIYTGEKPFLAYFTELRAEAREETWRLYEKHALGWDTPPAVFTAMDSSTIDLADLRGQVLLVDFWASWCGPCKMALPGLEKMTPELVESGEFRVIPANTWERVEGEERRALAQGTWDELGLSMPIYFDRSAEEGRPAVEAFGVSGIPTSFLIGKEGKILFKTIGYGGEAGERELKDKIEWAMSR